MIDIDHQTEILCFCAGGRKHGFVALTICTYDNDIKTFHDPVYTQLTVLQYSNNLLCFQEVPVLRSLVYSHARETGNRASHF